MISSPIQLPNSSPCFLGVRCVIQESPVGLQLCRARATFPVTRYLKWAVKSLGCHCPSDSFIVLLLLVSAHSIDVPITYAPASINTTDYK